MGWLDISSAPKDGTYILVCRYGWVKPRVAKFSHGTWWADGCQLIGSPDLWQGVPRIPPGISGESARLQILLNNREVVSANIECSRERLPEALQEVGRSLARLRDGKLCQG